jgi:hypothetical protein
MLQAEQLALQHARLTRRDHFFSSPARVCNRSIQEKRQWVSFKTLAAAFLLSATAATPAFAQAAIQGPGLFSFYYPNLDVLNGGAPTPAAGLSRDWPR